MTIPVQLHPTSTRADPVVFRWDTETDILTAALGAQAGSGGLSGSLEFAGDDGAWIVLDVRAGAIASVEVAVWPDVRKRPTLRLPVDVRDARVIVPDRLAPGALAVVQVDTPLAAESDESERTIHFSLGRVSRVAYRSHGARRAARPG